MPLLLTGCGLFPDLAHLGDGVPEAGRHELDDATGGDGERCSSQLYFKAQVPRGSSLLGSTLAAGPDALVVTAPSESATSASTPETFPSPTSCPPRTYPGNAGEGVIRVFERDGAHWTEHQLELSGAGEIAPLVPPAAFPGLSYYADAVIPTYSVFASGGRVIVGAAGDSALGRAFRGSVRVFSRTLGTWMEAPFRVEDPTSTDGDLFGFSVALSGSRLVVGAPGHDDEMMQDSGALYVYQLSASGYSQEYRLTAPIPQPSAWFGASVALSDDWIAVGAPGLDTNTGRSTQNPDVGAVYVYSTRDPAVPQPLRPDAVVDAGNFGLKVALAGDLLAVGSPGSAGCAGREGKEGRGAVVLYTLTDGKWSNGRCVDARITEPPGAPSDLLSSLFGWDLALGPDSLLVGAPTSRGLGDSAVSDVDAAATADGTGTAYLFQSLRDSVPRQVCRIKSPNADPCDAFGTSVAMLGDYVAVGASGEDGATGGVGNSPDVSNRLMDSGAVYLYAAPR